MRVKKFVSDFIAMCVTNICGCHLGLNTCECFDMASLTEKESELHD